MLLFTLYFCPSNALQRTPFKPFLLRISCLIERALALCLTVNHAERKREGLKKKNTEAVSHINETFKRHINKVDSLSGLAPPNIYISTSE